MKKTIRLSESDLHRVIKESVKRALNEIGDTNRGQYMLGRLAASIDGRKYDRKYNYGYAPEIEIERQKNRIFNHAKDQWDGQLNKKFAFSNGYNEFDHHNMQGTVEKEYNRYKNQDSNPTLQTVATLKGCLEVLLNRAYSHNGRVTTSELDKMLNMAKEIYGFYSKEETPNSKIAEEILNGVQEIVNGEGFGTGQVASLHSLTQELLESYD